MTEHQNSFGDQKQGSDRASTSWVDVDAAADASPSAPPEGDLLQLELNSNTLPPVDNPTAPSAAQDDGDDPSPNPSANLTPEEYEHQRTVGAGVGGGAVGLLIGGPFLALLLGFGTAYCVDKDGVMGDSARAVGDSSLVIRDKAKEVNRKHHVVDKTKEAAGRAWDRAKELDRQHSILERTKDWLVWSFNSVVDFCRRHRVVQRGVQGTGKAFEWIARKCTESRNERANTEAAGYNEGHQPRSYGYEPVTQVPKMT